jgi:subtilisin-like proprotein convertase family protein
MLFVTPLGVWRLRQCRTLAPVVDASPHSSFSPAHVPQTVAIPAASVSPSTEVPGRLALRLSNTPSPLDTLLRSPTAILLENALLDTAKPLVLPIPDHLRAQTDPGAYVVQSRAPIGTDFRARLQAAGARIVAYIPNQACLVRASRAAAELLRAEAEIQAVQPYEPYFKLKSPLLALAVEQGALPTDSALNLLLFPDPGVGARRDFERLGLEILHEESSPFGPVLTVKLRDTPEISAAAVLPALAGLPVVQGIELAHRRVLANDLSRARLAVSADTVTPVKYLGLTGTNVLVNVNDFGVDTNCPDLQGRVLFDTPISGVDSNGHGTHVAGIIAGDGLQSATVTSASGSVMPAVAHQFRGQAPAARVLSLLAATEPGPASDSYLQEAAAQSAARISNNSWHYTNDNAYDLAAARYDAAVRDALPGASGSQPLLFVFGAGNAGNGADDGSGGNPDSVQSPATAKNVITVGAIEQPRFITNQVWQCTTVNSTNFCATNQPWLGLTDSSGTVSAFSSRGNVGVGIEGVFGRLKPDVLAPGTFVVSARSTEWNQAAYYGPPDSSSNYSQVLSNLNNSLGPFYRYESGTSLAAAGASGVLALMQEYFQRYGYTNSPALMKALLINGARPLAANGALRLQSATNAQAWGLINLTNSLPAALTNSFVQARAPMQVFDQSPDGALATGQRHTRLVSLCPAATNAPIRFTLVWTDPPGNPAAGVKLVNNLDLIVTNLATGDVFVGNDIPPNEAFNRSWESGTVPDFDVVNNVENIYLPPSPCTNYSVTVSASAVNVNAVTARTNDIVQDYALVISSGDGKVPDAILASDSASLSVASAPVTLVMNSFGAGQNVSGGFLVNQRVGAQPLFAPSLSQWRFYVLTNSELYTNAAFATFLPPNLSLPRLGVNQTNVSNATRPEADIDLYVSTDSSLTNLNPVALAAADKLIGRRGTQALVYSNTAPGEVFYVGVKAEDQEAAEYSFLGVFSLLPFGEQDQAGTWVLRGINVPAEVPDGTLTAPPGTNVVAIAPAPIAIRRVVVTNELAHERFSDLLGTLTHGRTSVVLNSNSVPPVDPVPYEYTYVYEDNGEGDIAGSQQTDGPGSLRSFIGGQGMGVWLLTMADNVVTHTGQVESLSIRIDPQNVVNGTDRVVSSNAFSFDFVDVPLGATNLTVCAYNDSGIPLAVDLYVRRGGLPTPTLFDQKLSGVSSAGCLSITPSSLPPLGLGRYYLGVFNSNAIPQAVRLDARVDLNTNAIAPIPSASPGPIAILDDAITNASLFVPNNQAIASLDVGLLVTHPRVSDMVFTLISPDGTRVLLFENRGATSTNGLGGTIIRTNGFPTKSSGDFNAQTNVLPVGHNEGTLFVAYEFYHAPDSMHVYYDDDLIYDSGIVSGAADIIVPFGPGSSTNIVIILNEGNNDDTNTLWEYTATVATPVPGYLVFTERTNANPVPIKFATPPYLPTGTNVDLYCLPEQSLDSLVGQTARGTWKLELWDTRAGAFAPPPELAAWQLRFVFQNAVSAPIALNHGVAATNFVPPGEIAPFVVDVPAWASRVTNILRSASAPVNLLFNSGAPPSGTNVGDVTLLSASTESFVTLRTNSVPPLVPGSRYYLGIQNTGMVTVTAVVEMDFDVTPLANGVLLNATQPATPLARYFSYDVSSNATAVSFQLLNLNGNLNLVASTNTLLPTLASYNYGSFDPANNSEQILVFPDSVPVALAPGRWYLGIFNADPASVDYTILATEYTNAFPAVVTLTSGVSYPNSNTGAGDATDYYHFVVSTNAVRAQFEIDSPSGDMTLLARKGLPLPTLTNYTCLSTNPGANEELITLFDFSTPVALTPGDWFISAVNVSGAPVSYTLKAMEFPVYGTSFVITASEVVSNSLCLTWNSVSGIHYFVQGKANLSGTSWSAVSPTIVAADALTTWCIPLPSANRFFRISEGLVLTPYVPPVSISSITVSTSGVLLQWLAMPNNQFQVQWSPSLAPPAWTAFTNSVTATNGAFSFLDDGAQSGDLDSPRYYRLRQLP